MSPYRKSQLKNQEAPLLSLRSPPSKKEPTGFGAKSGRIGRNELR